MKKTVEIPKELESLVQKIVLTPSIDKPRSLDGVLNGVIVMVDANTSIVHRMEVTVWHEGLDNGEEGLEITEPVNHEVEEITLLFSIFTIRERDEAKKFQLNVPLADYVAKAQQRINDTVNDLIGARSLPID